MLIYHQDTLSRDISEIMTLSCSTGSHRSIRCPWWDIESRYFHSRPSGWTWVSHHHTMPISTVTRWICMFHKVSRPWQRSKKSCTFQSRSLHQRATHLSWVSCKTRCLALVSLLNGTPSSSWTRWWIWWCGSTMTVFCHHQQLSNLDLYGLESKSYHLSFQKLIW